MAACCTPSECGGTDRFFSKFSRRYAKQFKKKGLDKIQKSLLEGVRVEPVESKRILDIGCGVGALHLTLLKEGASQAVGIDIAEGMVDNAKRFALELGLADRAEHVTGDFVAHADSIGEADITLMDKVVCCYDDLESLVRAAALKTRGILALSHPRDNIAVRLTFRSKIAVLKFFKARFHPFWHDWAGMDAKIRSYGFHPVHCDSTFVWEARVYRRL